MNAPQRQGRRVLVPGGTDSATEALARMLNRLSWVDIPVLDLDRAMRFYSAVLGIYVRRKELAGESLGVFIPPGVINGCLTMADGPPSAEGPLLYLNCWGRLEEAQAAVLRNGGQVLQPVHALGPRKFRIVVKDSEGNRLALISDTVKTRETPLARQSAPRDARLLLSLAREAASEGRELDAYRLCREADAAAHDDGEISRAVRGLLSSFIPRYHIPMMNDTLRNTAWDAAMKRAIRPGMRVLEIGTGAGMLALMAARAGAEKVISCEYNRVVAELARETIACNGFSEKIDVISASSLALKVGVDLDEPADLLFCDNFTDNLFSLEPLRSIADARARLLKPNAPSLPRGASVKVALANWEMYARFCETGHAAGFHLGPMAAFVPDVIHLEIGDPRLTLRSEAAEPFRFDFAAASFATSERAQVVLEASDDCTVNGVAQWIRLQLDAETVLEARPQKGAVFFSGVWFYPLPAPRKLRCGETVHVFAEHHGRSLSLWT